MGQVVSIVKPIEKLVLEIRAHVHDAGRAETTAGKHQLQAGLRLIALRKRVEAGEGGEISWWDYFDQQFTGYIKSRSYAEKLMRWAGAEDPQAAIDAERERVRNAVQKHAAKAADSALANADERYQTLNDDLVGRALRLISKMSADELEEFHNRYTETYR